MEILAVIHLTNITKFNLDSKSFGVMKKLFQALNI
jgi:hypothetical protein